MGETPAGVLCNHFGKKTMAKPIHWRVYLIVWDNGREFPVMTNVYALSAQDAETFARAAAATEGWCVVSVRSLALPV